MKSLRLPVFSRFLADHRRALLGWSTGLIALCLMYLPLYPALGGGDLEALFAQLPEAFQSAFGLTTLVDGIGYTHSSLLSLSAVLLLLIAVLGWSTRAITGDEETGALELLLAHPVTRTQLVLQRCAGRRRGPGRARLPAGRNWRTGAVAGVAAALLSVPLGLCR